VKPNRPGNQDHRHDVQKLIEITKDENDHDAIYTAMLSRYESEGDSS
jgi:hypothetical protein